MKIRNCNPKIEDGIDLRLFPLLPIIDVLLLLSFVTVFPTIDQHHWWVEPGRRMCTSNIDIELYQFVTTGSRCSCSWSVQYTWRKCRLAAWSSELRPRRSVHRTAPQPSWLATSEAQRCQVAEVSSSIMILAWSSKVSTNQRPRFIMASRATMCRPGWCVSPLLLMMMMMRRRKSRKAEHQ